jgi:23S rRNA (cytidine1920-2'-O)/16S rRNA (cytidine1409-2'-O)-methyltransferase
VTRRPLDDELVRRGMAVTRSEARDAILAGRVTVAGRPASKPGSLVARDEPVVVSGPASPYASRGGAKLVAALDRFAVNAEGRRCLDAGASTGGFTDVLLSRGAEHVVAVDVGYGQLAWPLRQAPRVTVMDRTNVRSLRSDDLPYHPDLIVADLSFISLTAVIPALSDAAAPGCDLILLVKPQFESSPDDVGRGGVVSDPAVWRRAVERVAGACRAHDLGPAALMASPVRGPAGNVEFLLHARQGARGSVLDLDAAMAEGQQVRAS